MDNWSIVLEIPFSTSEAAMKGKQVCNHGHLSLSIHIMNKQTKKEDKKTKISNTSKHRHKKLKHEQTNKNTVKY